MSSSITSEQKAQLEAFFEQCPHPHETQQDQLTMDLGLQQEQIKEWFDNKRTQTQISQPEPQFPTLDNSRDVPAPPEQTIEENQPYQDYDDLSRSSDPNHELPNSRSSPTASDVSDAGGSDHKEKAQMLEIAKVASNELFKLMRTEEPIWIKSLNDGRLSLDRERYQRMFPKDSDPNVYKTPHTRVESSKASLLVSTNGVALVDALLDAEGMIEFFPTMIQTAEIIKEYEHGSDETRNGALLLVYLETHTLSPLVSSRRYFVLRYCQQLVDSAGAGVWLISDVSVDDSMGENLPHLPSWKLPSGCLIHEMPDGTSSRVMWIEHVEANDRPQTSLLYEELALNNVPYAAERWLCVLKRNSEKFNRFHLFKPDDEEAQAIPIKGRRSLLELSMRMAQSLCGILNTSSMPEMTHFSEPNSNNNDVVKFSIRMNSAQGHPEGMIVSAVTSFWLPLKPRHVFRFLGDVKTRIQWDALCEGHSMFEVANVPTGDDPGNRLSLIREHTSTRVDLKPPCDPQRNELMIFQESSQDPVASYIVFTPVDMVKMQPLMTGSDSSQLPVLPCGFVITGDANAFTDLMNKGREKYCNSQGTLLTVAYQMLVCDTKSIRELKVESLATANTLFRRIVDNIKGALEWLQCDELRENNEEK